MTYVSTSTLLIILVPLFILLTAGLYKIFEKSGEHGWKAIVPFYNILTCLKIVGKPSWHLIFYFIPIINVFSAFSLVVDIIKTFGKSKALDQALAIIFSPFYLAYLGFSPKHQYIGKLHELPKKKKTGSEEWVESIVFAVIAATFIRWVFMEAFTIPTPSMEKSLLVGDFLFVSKIAYGPRTPKTPLQVPLTHQKAPLIGVQSYTDLIQLPQFRLPGFGEVERNDVVVFNYPLEFEHPTDLKTHYIKRCVAVPGDVIEVKNTQVYINGEKGINPAQMQFRFNVIPAGPGINKRVFQRLDIPEWGVSASGDSYVMYSTQETANELAKMDFVKKVILDAGVKGQAEPRIFPDAKVFNWNADHFGPLAIPGKGITIPINKENLVKYGSTIQDYEGHDEVVINGDQLTIDGQNMTEYTFKQNYYFMMGDNRHNSLDSRYWGFVPEDHVVGEASFIWLSLDQNKRFPGKIRWNRFFKGIE